MEEFPKVKSVEPLAEKRLRVTFANGAVRFYDCSDLVEQPPFHILKDDAFFRAVKADEHGYGVVWSESLDLAESELWLHGTGEAAFAGGQFSSPLS